MINSCYFLSSVGNFIKSNIYFFYAEKDFYKLVYEYVRICLLKRKFVNIKFLPSKFSFVCCKAFRGLIKTKWYCQVEGFLRF